MILSSGIIPVTRDRGEWKFLLLRSFKYWDFPKGEVEIDEEPFLAAVRELEEETGITDYKKTWGEVFQETAPYGKGKTARYYVLEVPTVTKVSLIANPVTGIIEHHEARWVTKEEATRLLGERVGLILNWASGVIDKVE